MSHFDDFEDSDINADTVSGKSQQKKFGPRVETDRAETLFSEACTRCNGSGLYHYPSSRGVQCFLCSGKGVRLFKTSKPQREKARASAAARKERLADENQHAFEEAHPDIAGWWAGSDFPFAVSLRESVRKFGSLTERQLAAAKSCVVKFNAARAEKEQREATMKTVNVDRISRAMEKAKTTLKSPKVTLLGNEAKITVKYASPYGANAGALYVFHEEEYVGKIMPGSDKFAKSRDCTDAMEADVIAALDDPEQQAIAYGKRFGVCSCCGKTLTNDLSISLGIGPICRGKFFA